MKTEGATGAILKHTRGILISIVLGVLGGMICGSAILSLCALSGRIQTTGENYIGYRQWGLLLVGSMYGGPLGAIVGSLAYLTIVRTTGFRRAIGPAVVGTIAGGYSGSLLTPGLGLVAGIFGFFLALIVVRFRDPNPPRRVDSALS
jgi:hypothetical protein